MAHGKLQIDLRRALIPLSLLVMFILTFYFKVSPWVLAVFILWMPAYYIAWPMLMRRKWHRFEQTFAQKFQQRDFKGLLELYKANWLLRKFGPRVEMLTKLALIYTGMEKFREAEQALERAIDMTPAAQRDRLYFNLANVKYELGKYEQAEQMYKALRKNSPFRHSIQAQLALIHIQRGEDVEEARAILEKELGHASGPLKARIEQALRA
jgi:tetratricopeptide (TPR) repeat protein